MSKKINCWEYMQCEREAGGALAGKLGICPAASQNALDGFNRGNNAGRACWLVAGTFCSNRIQGSFAEKRSSCKECAFYQKIHIEEGRTHLDLGPLQIFAHTHIGRSNPSNEDRYLIKATKDNGILMTIGDGLGGNVAGDYAAELLRAKLAAVSSVAKGNEQNELAQLAVEIDLAICREKDKDLALDGMGSTLIGVFYRHGVAYWVHVGDSRLFLLRNRQLTQITKDQTLARFLLAEGEITAEEIPHHYSRNVMDQYIGCGYAEPETGRLALLKEDILILASDGLHRQVSADTIRYILATDCGLEEKSTALVKAALKAGGADNITVVLAQRQPPVHPIETDNN